MTVFRSRVLIKQKKVRKVLQSLCMFVRADKMELSDCSYTTDGLHCLKGSAGVAFFCYFCLFCFNLFVCQYSLLWKGMS